MIIFKLQYIIFSLIISSCLFSVNNVYAEDITYGTFTFDADNDADEDSWTFVSDNGDNGLNPSGTVRAWSHETNETPSREVDGYDVDVGDDCSTGGIGAVAGQGGSEYCGILDDGYVYTEMSITGSVFDTFHITLNEILDATTYDWDIEFYWNQRGQYNIATVEVQTNENNAGWVTRGIFAEDGSDLTTGADPAPWNRENIDLSSMISDSSTQIRLLVDVGYSYQETWQNDFGLDTITITGIDNSPPVITLLGDNLQPIKLNESYTELGADCFDDIDGDISSSIVIDTSNVDTTTLGTYQVTYDCAATTGITTQVIRDVLVYDADSINLNLLTSDSQVDLFWDNPTDDFFSLITDYKIEHKLSNDTLWHTDDIKSLPITNYIITNLVNGGESYDFRISGVTLDTEIPFNPISEIVFTHPDPPTELIIIKGIDETDLYWTAPANTGGLPITDYKIEYSSNNGNSWTVFNDGVSLITNLKITGTNNYNFRVSVVNEIGISPPVTSDGNILDFEKYKIVFGNPTLFSNSTGIYLSGIGNVYVKLEFNGDPNDQTTSVLFKGVQSSSSLYFYNNPQDNLLDSQSSNCYSSSEIMWDGVDIRIVSWDDSSYYYYTYYFTFSGTINDISIFIELDTITYSSPKYNDDPPPIDYSYVDNVSAYDMSTSDILFCSNDVDVWNFIGSFTTYLTIVNDYEEISSIYNNDFEVVNNPIFDNYFIFAQLNNGTLKLSGEYYSTKVLPPNNFIVDIGNQLIDFSWDCPLYDGIGYDNGCNNITNFDLYRNDISLENFTNEISTFTDYDIPLGQINIYKMKSTNNLGVTSDFSDTITIQSIEEPIIGNLTSDSITRTDTSVTIIFPIVTSVTTPDTFEIVRSVYIPIIYRVDSNFDSFTDSGIDEESEPCYQIRVRAFLGWSDFTNVECVDEDTLNIDTDTKTKIYDVDILLSVIPISDNTYLASLQYMLESDVDITFEYFEIYFENDEDSSVTVTTNDKLEYNNYISYNTNLSYGDDNLESDGNNIIIKSKYSDYEITTNTFDIDYLVDLEQSDTVSNGVTEYELSVDGRYVLYVEIDDQTIDTSCTLTDLHGTEITDDGDDGYILIDSESSSIRYYIDCTLDGESDYSTIYKSEKTLKNTIGIFGDTFGTFAGLDIGGMFIIFVASVFTKRNAYIGLFVIGVTTAIMVTLDVITLSTEWFGLIVVLIILGILTGRKL